MSVCECLSYYVAVKRQEINVVVAFARKKLLMNTSSLYIRVLIRNFTVHL